MIGYVTFGTNDLERAASFYDELLAVLGAGRAMEMEHMIAWSTGAGQPMLSAIKPNDGNTATNGNGTMVALAAPSKEAVDQLHAKALELGGKNEGAPGERGGSFYAGYFRDLDDNKLCVFYMG